MSILPEPDSRLANLITVQLSKELVQIEENIGERMGALDAFSKRIDQLMLSVAAEELWQRGFVSAHDRLNESPNTNLARKRLLIREIEACIH